MFFICINMYLIFLIILRDGYYVYIYFIVEKISLERLIEG